MNTVIKTPPPALPTMSAAIDQWIESILDEIDDPARGWRFFTIDSQEGWLLPLFGFDQWRRFPAQWVDARCRATVPKSLADKPLFDNEPHDVPGPRCGCGWRVYPNLAAATVAASVWPRGWLVGPGQSLDNPTVAFAGVEFAGGLCTRPVRPRRALDEAGTVRAEWLRITGPIYLPPGVPARAQEGLARHYPSCDVIELDEPPFDAVEADDLPAASEGAA